MRPLTSLGIGLSLVFGCLLLALLAELYYLFWWNKRTVLRDMEEGDRINTSREIPCLFSWKQPSSFMSTTLNPQEVCTGVRPRSGLEDEEEDSLESELMKLHNLCGPPRILFTIKEETKEDLESEDGKSRGGRSRRSSKGRRSLSELLFPVAVETPFLTPLSSPPFFTPPLTPSACYYQHGINPLFESQTDEEWNRMRLSPSPKFKFLKDAEEKLHRKILMEQAFKVHKNGDVSAVDIPTEVSPSPSSDVEEADGSCITIIPGTNREKGLHHQHHSSSSQVTPAPSPSTIRTSHEKLVSHVSSKQ